MSEVFKTLCKPLEREVRVLVQRNAESMMRTVLYRKDKNDEKLKLAFLRGWSLPTIEILVDVISFYQVVIGPVRSSSSLFTGHSWQSTEIQYGNKLRLDGDVAAGNDLMSRKFESIMQDLGIDFWWLQTTNADDLIFKLAKGGEDEDSPS